MLNYHKKMLKGCCLIVCALFLGSCGQAPEPASKPKKASRKITQKVLKPGADSKKLNAAKTNAAQETQPITPSSSPTDPAKGNKQGESQQTTALMATTFYNPEGRVDPFIALFKEEPEVVPIPQETPEEPTEERYKGPLERIELSQLKLRAVIRSPRGNRALVEEASGRGYIITRGTYIGTHSGTVIDILKDRVVVEEEVKDALGNLKVKETELKFPKPPGEE